MAHKDGIEKNLTLEAFTACKEGLIRSIMKMSVQQADVDDILQEAYLRAFNANEKTRIKSSQDYLFVVSRNLVIKALSRQSKEIATEIDDQLLGADGVSTEMEVHYQIKFQAFNEALKTLPEKNRRAILLRKFYNLSHREIAKKMGVSVSSVEKYISVGINRCAKLLRSQGYDELGLPSEKNRIEPHKASSDNTAENSNDG